ncbi:MAG TPA: helix-turn-helix domain-containing protein [Actinomycetota bacterium]|nr:helix-turn-helix domain-containing protein [Actinomycetota bacterium]
MPTTLPEPVDPDVIAGILSDRTRRSIYLHLRQRMSAATVNEIAERFAIHRNAAKFHLDKLLEAGLLRAEFKRVNGRKGPGAGRPSKLYTATEEEISFSVPERHYDLLATLLLRALTSGDDIEQVGRAFGRELALAAPGTEEPVAERVELVLSRLGFDPAVHAGPDGHLRITTQNCPFGRVALEAPNQEVCRLDRSIVQGLLEGFGMGPVRCEEHSSLAMGAAVCVREVAAR